MAASEEQLLLSLKSLIDMLLVKLLIFNKITDIDQGTTHPKLGMAVALGLTRWRFSMPQKFCKNNCS